MKDCMLALGLVFVTAVGAAQITVTETNLKIGNESLYYGFEAGDKVTLTMSTTDGKTIKEVEILRYPDQSKYANFKVSNVEQTIDVPEKGIYEFRFKNPLKKRVCNIKITRTPGSSGTQGFNTGVTWRTVTDTTFYTVQEKYVVRADTSVQMLVDQEFKLTKNLNNSATSKKVFTVNLPANTEYWSYIVGLKNEVDLGYELADVKMRLQSPDTVTKYQRYNISPLTWTSFGYAPLLIKMVGDVNVSYHQLLTATDVANFNANLPFNKQHTGFASMVMERGRQLTSTSISAPKPVYFAVQNSSVSTDATMRAKIEAVVINKTYGTREVEKFKVRTYKKPFHMD